MSDSIHPNTSVGAVHLTVANLDRLLEYYQHNLGFRLQQREGGTAYLGAGADEATPTLLVLLEQPGAGPVRGTSGLFHLAILVPSRLHLARSLRHLFDTRTRLQGFSDHVVSEAIYLADPEGNGIEIYRDRPRQAWYDADGQFRMATDPLDLDDVMAELEGHAEPWEGLDSQTVIGHVHLHVANVSQAEDFYVRGLGFELMTRYGPSASFVSAGGYHHHIAFNTWAGVGTPPPPTDATGLKLFTVRLPDAAEAQRLAERLRQANWPFEQGEEGLFVRDPSQNGLLFVSE